MAFELRIGGSSNTSPETTRETTAKEQVAKRLKSSQAAMYSALKAIGLLLFPNENSNSALGALENINSDYNETARLIGREVEVEWREMIRACQEFSQKVKALTKDTSKDVELEKVMTAIAKGLGTALAPIQDNIPSISSRA